MRRGSERSGGKEANEKAELSLTVPITNSLAFLFTVVGEWWAEKKVINRGRDHSGSRRRQKWKLTAYRHLDRHGFRIGGYCSVCTE